MVNLLGCNIQTRACVLLNLREVPSVHSHLFLLSPPDNINRRIHMQTNNTHLISKVTSEVGIKKVSFRNNSNNINITIYTHVSCNFLRPKF